MENSSIKDRIAEFCKEMRISQRKFEKSCGLGYGFISHARASISPSSIKAIENAYPNINLEWLLDGKGEMLKEQSQNISNKTDVSGNKGISVFGNNGTSVSCSQSHLDDITTVGKAIEELSEMRKLLAESIKNQKEQSDKFLSIIADMAKK